jgi:hypothetical protein
MTDGVKCPICGQVEIEPVLDQIKVTASYDGFQGQIGALLILRCKGEGHIFFVRAADIQILAA